ncbi:uncharacterized protein LOC133734257 [Rosa rugosa]|uniref:uncharacterized protein LOC133734257 n=1 Tax=Rosa rugosa TaxID=74645 RepID=UPI002B415D3B|nr:uncharacterized protein LOC133734257 [Rosa rugosa]
MAENSSINPKHLYQSLKNGDTAKVMEYCYDKTRSDDERLKLIPTVHDDTILHLAINMGQQDIAKEIVKRCSGGSNDKLLMKKNALGNTVLHEAAATSMTSLVEELLRKASDLLSISNNKNEMPLYTAAYYGQTEMFKLLADEVDKNQSGNLDLDLHLRPRGRKTNPNKVRTTILHAAIHAEFFELALLIAKRYTQLVKKKDENQLTGLQLLSCNPSAFRSGTKYGPIKRFIYSCAPNENVIMDRNGSHEHEEADEYIFSDLGDEENTACFKMPQSQTCTYMNNRCTIALRQAISSVNRAVWKILQAWGTMKRIYGDKKRHESAFKLAKLLIAADFSWDSIGVQDEIASSKVTAATNDAPSLDRKADIDWIEALLGAEALSGSGAVSGGPEIAASSMSELHSPPTPLLLATRHGILEIVDEILKVYPLAVEHISEMGQNLLHVAVLHRQLDVFQRVIRMESPKSRLVRRIDNNGFTILHHVGNMAFYKGSTQPGPALQLQEELEWFEIVEQVIPPHYAMQLAWNEKEQKNETPKQYFRCTHGELLKEAQDWIKRTAESCSTVAGLMATVAFAAAFTVPGGNDEKSGTPLLLHSPFFLVFIITDAFSLASSLTSLVMFLSILTSPYEIDDFRYSLPRKLILGFTFLFFSVAVTMLAFASTLMLTISTKKSLTTTFIYCVAFLPVTMFALLQFPLYVAFKTTLLYSVQAIQSVLPWHLISVGFSKLKNN